MKVTIRQATKADVDQVVHLMFSAGPDAYRYVFSINHADEALDFLRYAYLKGLGEFGYQGHSVACIKDNVVGVIGLRTYQDNNAYVLSALKNIIGFYGVRQGLKVIWRGLRFERVVKAPKANRLYIHNVGVCEYHQGEGIGRKLISYAIAQAKARDLVAACLDVAILNKRAKALYLKYGFRTRHVTASALKSEFGRGLSHEYMELTLL
ncbi:GNAT family N-acetyltransferase [Thalassotalea euphylliae]|uniref:GNAT family N-acetyltransferase n=1 Tax=Thalassotalea euphylliae TaxID=1655234 RepID=UPI0036364356